LNKVFLTYERLDVRGVCSWIQKSKYGEKNGSGIGLTLSKQIMLLHHGNIDVGNTIEGQTGFFLTFQK